MNRTSLRLTAAALLAGAVLAIGGTGTAQAATADERPAGQPVAVTQSVATGTGAVDGVTHAIESAADAAADVLRRVKETHEWG
ncbi:hypothetical protein [Streptomyces sp. NPDC093225]|uniref:hypothetical protein n=1 Tax=Streptomyces sp. NPDC093225 TaxID=3366034 RepID=UPI0038299EC1